MKKIITINFFVIIILSLSFIYQPQPLGKDSFPVYRVVIDPGHGGVLSWNLSLYGDKYDSISNSYLEAYKPGAAYRGLEEHILMYQIGQKVYNILFDLTEDGDFEQFAKVLKRYTSQPAKKIVLDLKLSRNDKNQAGDKNKDFRLYDYKDAQGNLYKGRISEINEFKPHLVVALHCAYSGAEEYHGFNPVIVAPYDLLNNGLEYLKGNRSNLNFFHNSVYNDKWFNEDSKFSNSHWFLMDVSTYFLGYRLNDKDWLNKSSFKSYRYNMVSWSYNDPLGWQNLAESHLDYSHYAHNLQTFKQEGPFWDRERSIYEKFRRSGGYEGYGGDNLYASREILKFMVLNLEKHKVKSNFQQVGKPYCSIWALPLLVNAVTAYVELGYLRIPYYRKVLTKKQDEIAEGLAVGIYSLLCGVDIDEKKKKNSPKGLPLDFDKYKVNMNETYFDVVVNK